MVKMLFRSLIAVVLLSTFNFGIVFAIFTAAHEEDAHLLYLGDYSDTSSFYLVLDIETGKTHRFQRPEGYVGSPYYGGECCYQDRVEITSPHDDSLQFVLLSRYNAQNTDDTDQLYRVGEDDELELVLAGEYIYVREQDFTDNGRYAYIFKKSGSDIHSNLYTLYRYDIQSTELWIVASDISNAGLQCPADWCLILSGSPRSETTPQSLYALNKNSGDLRQIASADAITIHYWRDGQVLYTPYRGDGMAPIQIYNIETNEHSTLAAMEGQGIASIFGADWLMVSANSLENNRIFDVYIVNDLASNPTTYPLGIQTSNANWLFYRNLSDGSMLLITLSSQNDGTSDVYIVNDVAGQPVVNQVTSADFDAEGLQEVRLETDLGDTHLMRVGVSDDEWRYYSIHGPTRTITQLATFSRQQQVYQTHLSADNRWLALSIEESGNYYLGLVAMDGSQGLKTWDVGTESYVCLLAWYAPEVTPPACDLYFGIG